MKKIWIWSGIAISLTILFLILFFLFKPTPQEIGFKKVTYSIIPGKYSGWGYAIFVDGKLFIKQDEIPAVEGRNSFKEKKDAEKVARFAIEKMKTNYLPSITPHEIDSLGVLNNIP